MTLDRRRGRYGYARRPVPKAFAIVMLLVVLTIFGGAVWIIASGV